ncbi:MAG: OmpA family protein [Arcicella sp.]|nr:OmpA family protein [Arcicella sp.]
MNLLALLKDNLTPEMISKAASLVGENQSSTAAAMSGILPAILGSVVGKASTADGASSVMSMITDGGHDGSVLNNLGGVLGGGSSTDNMLSGGAGILSSLLGDKVGGIVSLISNFAGIKSGSASSLMNMSAPLVMGMIGKQVSSQGLNASGLMGLLSSQKDHIADAMPAGLGDKLGGLLGMGSIFGGASSMISGLAGDASKTVSSATNYASDAVEEVAGGLPKWLLPLLIGAAVIAGLLYFMKGCGNKTVDAVTSTLDSAATTATVGMDSMASKTESAVTGAADALKKLFKLKLPDGTEIEVPEGSLEDQIVKFIQDDKQAIDKKVWFNFDRLLFDTGRSTLKMESKEQIEKTVAILKAFPKVKIKIGGYTDNVGKAASNMKLSAERAAVVMDAIVAGGIDKSRLESEGYGDKNPVDSNDTEEGKAKNRRIAISVREK